ncbi:hypothetical protein KSP39_PZI003195 [Platanthera zijinensis]|uniref:Uncharacterized protein n=1 Tax=Platanthera zijinensis TaxID=2320716 RepID=A0AAP0BX07_9ASPA
MTYDISRPVTTVRQALPDSKYSIKTHNLCSAAGSKLNIESCSYVELQKCNEANRMSSSQFAMEGPSGDGSCYQITMIFGLLLILLLSSLIMEQIPVIGEDSICPHYGVAGL